MTRVLFYLALAFLIWQIARNILRRVSGNSPVKKQERQSEPRRVSRQPQSRPSGRGAIDYSRVRDAEYRDIR